MEEKKRLASVGSYKEEELPTKFSRSEKSTDSSASGKLKSHEAHFPNCRSKILVKTFR